MESHFSLCPDAEQQQLVEALSRTLQDLPDLWDSSAVYGALLNLGLIGSQLDEHEGGLGQSLATLALVHEELGLRRAHPSIVESTILGTDIWGLHEVGECRVDQAFWSGRPTVRGVRDLKNGHWLISGSVSLSGSSSSERPWLVWFEDEFASRYVAMINPVPRAEECQTFSPLQTDRQVLRFESHWVSAERVRVAHRIPRPAWAILRSAELVGWSQSVLDQCTDYVQTREQFGGPIGRFQAIQHSLARMLVCVEAARSAVYGAACLFPLSGDTRQEWSHAAQAVLEALQAAQFCTQEAIQVHGGMGYTRDCGLDRPLFTCFQIEAQLQQMTHWAEAIQA